MRDYWGMGIVLDVVQDVVSTRSNAGGPTRDANDQGAMLFTGPRSADPIDFSSGPGEEVLAITGDGDATLSLMFRLVAIAVENVSRWTGTRIFDNVSSVRR